MGRSSPFSRQYYRVTANHKDRLESQIQVLIIFRSFQMDWHFSDVYNICVAIPDPLCDRLYSSLVGCIEDHVRGLCRVSELLNMFCEVLFL